jgi:hypothetical protein
LPTPDLETEARRFGDDISDLLNRTVANGARVSAVLVPERATCIVGCNVTRRNIQPLPVPLTLGRKPPRAHLWIGYVLQLDEEGEHLAVTKSGYGLYLDEDRREMLMHYDYERDPPNDYPAAHFQINGRSVGFDRLLDRVGLPARELRDFHFPVGGRRFRPTLEEVIEFLVIEGLVEALPGWTDAIAYHRERWEDRQLRAAVRRNPDVAAAELRELAGE